MRRLLFWSGTDAWRTEVATVELGPGGLSASGTQVGVDPIPYRLDYVLEAADGFLTRALNVEVIGNGWSRRLSLRRDVDGTWRCETSEQGDPGLPPSGGGSEPLEGALDCDLGLSPLTNLLPIRRHELHRRPGRVDLLAAWVSVPDLALHAARHRYEHVRVEGEGGVVRFLDRDDGFTADLVVDGDGFVLDYPELARRVASGAGP